MVILLLALSAFAAMLSAWWWIASARIELPELPPKLAAPVTAGPDGRPLGPVSMLDEAARLDLIIGAVDQIALASRSAAILNRITAFAAAAAAILAALSLMPPIF